MLLDLTILKHEKKEGEGKRKRKKELGEEGEGIIENYSFDSVIKLLTKSLAQICHQISQIAE